MNQNKYEKFSSMFIMKPGFILLTILILGANTSLFSQSTSFGYRSGLGIYSMESMKEFQQFSTESLAFPTKKTQQFPVRMFHRLQLNTELFRKMQLYFFYSYYNTGGRISSIDNSAKYKMDLQLNGHTIGTGTSYDFQQLGALTYTVYIEFGFTTTYMDVFESMQAYDEDFEYNAFFMAENMSFEGGLQASYSFQRIIFSLNLGYMPEIAGDFHYPYSEEKLTFQNGALKPEWSGIRTGVQLAFTF